MVDSSNIPRLAGGPCPPRSDGGRVSKSAGKRLHNTRRGFSFVELLFAIMILGIGFIMIAAIFPVAIKQTAQSGEETVASTIAKGAVGVIQQVASNALMPTTNGKVFPVGPTTPSSLPIGASPPSAESAATLLWAAISGNTILPSDNRYAWAAMYERDASNPPYAQLIVIGMQVRNRTQYTLADTTFITNGNAGYPNQPNLQPKQVLVQFSNNGGATPDTVTFQTNSPVEDVNIGAAGPGAYLVISDDGGTVNEQVNYASSTTTCNGTIYRIGNPTTVANQWELLPGNDLYSQQGAPVVPKSNVSMGALLVGKSLHDPTLPFDPSSNPYEGLAQDISVYVTFVRINN